MEDYKKIKGYENYSINKNGKILRGKKEIKSFKLPNGYARVNLYSDGKAKQLSVHRLVAIAFLGEPENEKMVVNHKNSIRNDNRVENLEWMTMSENVKYGYTHGFADREKVKKQLDSVREKCLEARRKKCEITNTETKEVFNFGSAKEAAETLQLNRGSISSLLRGEIKSLKGYTGKYI